MPARSPSIGYPNVGKSTLVNRLLGRRETVVHQEPGVTRDRKEIELEWNGVVMQLIDTGGIDIEAEGSIGKQITEQARIALAEADLILFVVDVQTGVTAGDTRWPRSSAAEDADDPRRQQGRGDPTREAIVAAPLYELGLGDPFPVSAIHGTNSGDLLDHMVERLAAIEGAARDVRVSDEIGVAILGRPNVGKSSLFNALFGQPRAIVSDIPGTTRDSFDTRLTVGETTFRLIDTAGLRRMRKHRQQVEYWSEVRALHAAQHADIALVLVDAQEGLTDQDLHVADEARKAGCATIVVVSKWDIHEVDLDDAARAPADQAAPAPGRDHVQRRHRPRRRARAAHHRGLYGHYTSRIGTGELNRLLKEAAERQQAPLIKRRRLKLLYGAQVQTRPPRFRITVNDRKLITADYAYYLENRIREGASLESCPVIVDFVAR